MQYWDNYYVNDTATSPSVPTLTIFNHLPSPFLPWWSHSLLPPHLSVSFPSLLRVQYLSGSHRHLQSFLHDPGHPLCHLLFREGAGLPAPTRWDVLCLRRSDVANNVSRRPSSARYSCLCYSLKWGVSVPSSTALLVMNITYAANLTEMTKLIFRRQFFKRWQRLIELM